MKRDRCLVAECPHARILGSPCCYEHADRFAQLDTKHRIAVLGEKIEERARRRKP